MDGNLDEEIYMDQTEDYKERGKEKSVCILKKYMYGLKQEPRT